MATNSRLVRKNGYPVKRFWHERITSKARAEYYSTTYPIYFTSFPSNDGWAITDEKAPRDLQAAIDMAKAVVESPEDPQTQATVYEMRAVYRVGTEFDWPAHKQEQSAIVQEFNAEQATRRTN